MLSSIKRFTALCHGTIVATVSLPESFLVRVQTILQAIGFVRACVHACMRACVHALRAMCDDLVCMCAHRTAQSARCFRMSQAHPLS